ncbi:SDR family NAD(P)-dependent oxidoreductase [Amycolatopsis sp. NPDC051903]|uniref:SDR family NAD(P)-dependent oxidoreductase n=1 Tax=Amycolatopsis sp. NPDC051903 TaxID=3363936 RepID=UPI0037AC52A9
MTTQKVAVITGASQGIGAGLVDAYRKSGYQVVATSRGITDSGDAGLAAVAGDIADPATARAAVATALEKFGRLDTVVNNAGIFIAKPFTDYTDEDFRQYLGVNVAGFYHLTQPALPHLAATGAGHVVTITTTLTERANSNIPSALASLTKGGLNAATRSLAIEYAQRGVRFNAVSPGIIKTPMHDPATYETLAAQHPVNRLGDVGDIVDAVLYLEHAPFVTGEILHVDGGQIAGR